MYKQFLKEISKLKLSEQHKIGLAISGGVDSVVLLHLMFQSGFNNILLLHVNYGLRDKDSDEDELFLRNIAEKYHLEIEVLNAKHYFENHIGIQEKARKIRYDWFETYILKNKIDFILTAHHKNDLVETFLLNLFRKTGLSGLTGMDNLKKVLRPLLPFSRKEIENFAKENNIEWRIDKSNLESKYSRNFIRNEIIPNVEQKFNKVVNNVYETASMLKQEKELLTELVNNLSPNVWIRNENKVQVLSLKKIQEYKNASLLLHYLIEDKGFNYAQTNEMSVSVESGKIWHSQNFSACTNDGELWIISKSLLFNDISFKWIIGKNKTIDLGVVKVSTESSSNYNYKLFLNNSFLDKEIEMRFWKNGDKILISTNGSSKKLSDLFTEHKIPVLFRKMIPVFVVENQIVWVAGLRVSQLLKNQQPTDHAVQISVKTLLI